MLSAVNHSVAIVVDTVLELCDIVVEVAAGREVVRVWEANNQHFQFTDSWVEGKLIEDLASGDILQHCVASVANWAMSGNKPSPLKFQAQLSGVKYACKVHFFTNHPDPSRILIGIRVKLIVQKRNSSWKSLFNAVGDGVWKANLETGAIKFSSKWQEFFGYSQNEITTIIEWESKIHPVDLERKRVLLAAYKAGALPHYAGEIRYQRKDGTYRWILSRGVEVGTEAMHNRKFIGTHTDIHERKMAEMQHAATLDLLSALIDNIQEGIMVTDSEGRVIFTNQMFCDMFGYTMPRTALLGNDILDHPIEKQVEVLEPEVFVRRLSKIVKERQIVLGDDFELADGRIISRDYVPLSIDPTNKGQIWKFRDVTSQRNISKQFRKQREFYEKILNSIPADVSVFDKNRCFKYVNPAAIADPTLRIRLIGMSLDDYATHAQLSEEQHSVRRKSFDELELKRAPVEFEEVLANENGGKQYLLRRYFPLFDSAGEIDIVIGYGVNITDIRNAEHSLKLSNDVFSSAFNHSAIGIGFVSPAGKWLNVNEALCSITGYSRRELLQLTYQEITFPDDLDRDLKLVDKLLHKELASYTLEKRYLSKDGRIVWVLLTVSMVWKHDGTPNFFISQVLDITRQHELNDEITRQNKELKATRNSLVAKVSQLEEMGHMIAHNLRGPVNNIKLIAESLVGEEEDKLFSNEEAGAMIHQSAIGLINALNNLMELTRIKLDKEIKYDDCNLSEVIDAAKGLLMSSVYEKRALITMRLGVEQLSYPKVYLESIIYNLLSNAIKYSSPERKPEIIISSSLVDGRVLISVKDNGIGIDLQKHGNDMFRLNKIFHEGYESNGIGLYMTKTQVENLGGTIAVNSEVNVGTEFLVTL